jgi:cyclase
VSTTHTEHGPLAPPRVEDLGGGLYAYIQPDGSWFINNTGFLVSTTGVICVDGCATARRTRDFLAAVSTTTSLPVRTLVNTHSHPDHVTGNALFSSATIIAHEETRAGMLANLALAGAGGFWEPFDPGSLPMTLPFLTYRDGVSLWVDDLLCEVRHVGMAAHTTNDSIVWVPSRRVLYAGDLVFNGGTPFCLTGSVVGTIRVLTEQILPLEAQLIVPGHGDLCGPEAIGPIVDYLRLIVDVAGAGIAAGVTPLEAARETDLGPYAAWTDTERIVGNLHRTYAELQGRDFGPLDAIAALTDMVAYNGGRPLTCLA